MGVMADLSGNAPGVEKEEIANRKFLDFDMDNFDRRMAAIQPGVAFRVENKLAETEGEQMSVNLNFNKMDDFSPANVAKQIPSLAALLEARSQLANLMRYMDGKAAAESQLKALLNDPQLMAALRDRAPVKSDDTEDQS